jgi:hypothetical protein
MAGPSVERGSCDNAIVPEGPAFVYPAWKQAPIQDLAESTVINKVALFALRIR